MKDEEKSEDDKNEELVNDKAQKNPAYGGKKDGQEKAEKVGEEKSEKA